MGNRMNPELRRLLIERRITRIRPDRNLVLKELDAARSDLADAKDSLGRDKFKWATIQAYYSMFHSARALVYMKGFREKSHHALLVTLRETYLDQLGGSYVRAFEEGMDLRQEADYGLRFSETAAVDVVENAEKFLQRTKEILEVR